MFFEQSGQRLVWRGDGEVLVVEPWGADSLRVRAAIKHEVLDTDFALLPPGEQQADITIEDARASVRHGRIEARLEAAESYDWSAGHVVHTCTLAFYDADGALLLRERPAGGSLKLKARHFQPITGGPHAITASFEGAADEKLYGMGQYQQELGNLKGATFELAHRNSQASVPFVLSSAGYGFLWHNPAIGQATFATNGTQWHARSSEQLDYWITAGATPREIVAHYADATGHVPMMPEYGLGFWQCKLRYWNQEQLLEVAREHKRRGLPMDVIVADFFHWPKMGDYRFEDEFWPDPRAMVDELAGLGIKLMVSIWPQVSVESENFAELYRRGHLVQTERGMRIQMSFEGPSMFLDVTDPSCREHVWEICKANYYDQGIHVFWLDEAEPEYGEYDFDNYRYHAGPNVAIGNQYPQLYARTFYDGMTAAGQQDVVNLLRCAWAGSQRYGALVWSGDIHSTFEDLRRQIVAGLHMGIAGIPWFTTDIGGFHDGDITDPAFHELLVRWFGFGLFSPVMRLHGNRVPNHDVSAKDGSRRLWSGAENELWSYGDEVYAILERYLHLREELRPYTRRLMAEAHEHGQPVMRTLFHEFPDDPAAWDVTDQWLYGPDLLVAPVVHAGTTSRSVYLPAGARWTDLVTGAEHEGGTTVEVDAPLAVIPVFGRDGAGAELKGKLPTA